MTEINEDITVQDSIDFVHNLITREDMSQELILMYEQVYREVRRVAKSFNIDTSELDNARNNFMKTYGQI
jgi:hypothetical protein